MIIDSGISFRQSNRNTINMKNLDNRNSSHKLNQEWVKKFESRVYSLIEALCRLYNNVIDDNYGSEFNERKTLLKKKVRKLAGSTAVNWVYNANIKGLLKNNLCFRVDEIVEEDDLVYNVEKFLGTVEHKYSYKDALLRKYEYISKSGNLSKPFHERIYEALLIKESNLHLSLPPNLIKKYFDIELFGTEKNTVVDFLAPFESVSKGNLNNYGGKCLGSFHTWIPPEEIVSEEEEFCFSPHNLMALSSEESSDIEDPMFDLEQLSNTPPSTIQGIQGIHDVNVMNVVLSPPTSPRGKLTRRSTSAENFFNRTESLQLKPRKLFSDLDPIMFNEVLDRHNTEKRVLLANPPFDHKMILFLAKRIEQIMDNNTTIIVTIPIWDNETKVELNAKPNQVDFLGYKLLKESPWFYDEKLSNAFIHRFYSYTYDKYIAASSCHVMLFRSGNGCITLDNFLKDWEKEGPERNYVNVSYAGVSHPFEYQDDDFKNGIIFGTQILKDLDHNVECDSIITNKGKTVYKTSIGNIYFTSKSMFFRGAAIVMKKILNKSGSDVYTLIQCYYPDC